MLPLWWFSWLEMLVLDQDKDCVSYKCEETELMLALVCFFSLSSRFRKILVHCVKFEGLSSFRI